MADYTSFTPWRSQIEELEPSVRSKSYRVSTSGLNVRLINANGEDEGMVAFINDRGNLGGGRTLLDRLRPILNGPTDEERNAQNNEPEVTDSGAQAFPAGERPIIQSQEIYQTLADFAASDLGGLRNDRDQRPAIEELQEFLNELGLDTGGVDGRYGPRTTAAVRRLQGAFDDVVVDGDAGPETIGLIQDVKIDTARMEELLDVLNESALPVVLKSGLAQLLERDLTQAERTELEQLVNKYEDFRQEFPEFNSEIFVAADQAIQSGGVSQAATAEPVQPQTATTGGETLTTRSAAGSAAGPFVDGMVIIPDINNDLEAIGRDRGLTGERLTPEDVAALNQAVANGDIDAAYLNTEVQEPEVQEPEPAPAAQTIINPDTPFDQWKVDARRKIEGWLMSNPNAQTTTQWLETWQLERQDSQQLQWINTTFRTMVLKLARGDRIYDIDGLRVELNAGLNTDNADIIQDWLRSDIATAIQQVSNTSVTGNAAAQQKARRLYDAMSGVGVNRSVVSDTVLSIVNAQEYEQVNREFENIANQSLWSFIDSQMFFSTTNIERHLTNIGVNITASESAEIINITKRLLER